MNYLDQLEKILDQGYRLVSMETYDVSRVIDLFTELSRFTNKAYYCWNAGVGVHRIGASHITIPRTQTAKDLLTHIKNSKHYGIYILTNLKDELEDEYVVQELRRIAVEKEPKVIVLLDEFIALPPALKPYTLRSKHQMRKAG
jgi:hypothetical protein